KYVWFLNTFAKFSCEKGRAGGIFFKIMKNSRRARMNFLGRRPDFEPGHIVTGGSNRRAQDVFRT
ncbi:MAG: hypothetical protein D6714_07075, partial [Bacteroidetes bacterium]